MINGWQSKIKKLHTLLEIMGDNTARTYLHNVWITQVVDHYFNYAICLVLFGFCPYSSYLFMNNLFLQRTVYQTKVYAFLLLMLKGGRSSPKSLVTGLRY